MKNSFNIGSHRLLKSISLSLWGIGLLFCCFSFSVAHGQPAKEKGDDPLPKLRDMAVPSLDDLLTGKLADWVVLKNLDVIVVEPVSPRPETLKKMQASIEASTKWPRPKTIDESEDQKNRKRLLAMLQVTLIDGGNDADFQIHLRHIEKIVYHEDHLLQRIQELLDNQQLPRAAAALAVLLRRQPKWPGAEETLQKLLFLEGEAAKDPESALNFFEELRDREPSYPGLSKSLGSAVDQLLTAAVGKSDFRRARHFLARLANRYAEHGIVAKWQSALREAADERVQASRTAATEGNWPVAVAAIEQAARIWPQGTDVRNAHKEITTRYPILQVGVLSLPGEASAYPFEDAPAWRHRALTTIPLFAPARVEADLTAYRSQFVDLWEPTDLGRQIRMTLRSRRPDFESRPTLTASQLADQLAARLQPDRSDYDDRLAGFVQSIAVTGPFELSLSLRKVPYRFESLLTFPATDRDGATEQRFRLVERDARQALFRRTYPQQNGTGGWRIAEIVETRYESWERALQGLMRAEVTVLPEVAPRDLPALQRDPRFVVLPYAQPVTHLLVFSPRSVALKRGELRRALIAGVNRPRLLKDIYLEVGSANVARLTSTALPQSSRVVPLDLPEQRFQPGLSGSLAATARKNLGNDIPPLKLACPADPRIRATVKSLIADWAKLGIPVQIVDEVPPGVAPPDQFDLAYRTVRIAEPLTEFWPLLTWEPNTHMESLSQVPSWLRNRLLAIDQVSDWESALKHLGELQHNLLADARYLPLWEVDEYWVARKRLQQVPQRLLHPYQNADRWLQPAWYPEETP